MGYEQAKLRGAASYVSWVVTRTLSLTTRQSARRDPYGRLPDALGMCDDLRRAGRSARFILYMRQPTPLRVCRPCMRRIGPQAGLLLPWRRRASCLGGFPCARARASRSTRRTQPACDRTPRWPRSRSPSRSFNRHFWREIPSKPQTQIVQGLEVRKNTSGALSTRLVKLIPGMSSTGATSSAFTSPQRRQFRILRPRIPHQILRSKNE